ncbi:hypothetical protein PoB_003423800 [Plakobranchus ocellatus]|uniref:Uncharacterized protein n=1 Tax=Plakobranchus ocellatus TaxID=259542 RepID=A0AAV4AK99_9GAST|nr:hypothetical protein PoB_003423800 [Plakobranchus ocellatus]
MQTRITRPSDREQPRGREMPGRSDERTEFYFSGVGEVRARMRETSRKQAKRDYVQPRTITNPNRYNALCSGVEKIGHVTRTKELQRVCENLN